MEKQLDLFTASEYDLFVGKNRTLNSNITCTYLDVTGGTQYFDFSGYTGATMMIKNVAGTVLLQFSTTDNSIELLPNGVFKLNKSAKEMDVVRAGQYNYDMYLSSAVYPKRAFLYGKITLIQNISN